MNVQKDWQEIRKFVIEAYNASRYFSLASVNPDGTPHVTPIGSLILYNNCLGIYCEKFPRQLVTNLSKNRRVCIMVVNDGLRYWLKAITTGRFPSYPGIRLTGFVGEKREGTPEEMNKWLKRVKIFKKFKGYRLLWNDMRYVREIHFDGAFPITAGKMTQHLQA